MAKIIFAQRALELFSAEREKLVLMEHLPL
jgi:hypothetical protein